MVTVKNILAHTLIFKIVRVDAIVDWLMMLLLNLDLLIVIILYELRLSGLQIGTNADTVTFNVAIFALPAPACMFLVVKAYPLVLISALGPIHLLGVSLLLI